MFSCWRTNYARTSLHTTRGHCGSSCGTAETLPDMVVNSISFMANRDDWPSGEIWKFFRGFKALLSSREWTALVYFLLPIPFFCCGTSNRRIQGSPDGGISRPVDLWS